MIKYKLEPCKLNDFLPFNGTSDIKNYEDVIKIFTKTVFHSGLFYINQSQENKKNQVVTILEQFYIYLDLYPNFRKFVF